MADICMSKLTFFRGHGETLKSGFGERGHFFFFFAALGLCCCVQVFSSCEWELLSRCGAQASHCHGFSCSRGPA